MKTFVIYVLTSPSGKRYVGQTSNFKKRMRRHELARRNMAIHAAIRKYGWENFEKEIVSDNVPAEDVDYFEKRWIQHLNTLAPNGYNLNGGGNGSKIVSAETSRKISESNRGRRLSDDTKRKIGNAHRGKTAWNKGKEMPASYREKMLGMHPLSFHIEIHLYLRASWSIRKINRDTGKKRTTIRKYRDRYLI